MKNLDAYTGKLQVELTNNFQEYFGKLSWNFTEQVDETFCLVTTYLLIPKEVNYELSLIQLEFSNFKRL